MSPRRAEPLALEYVLLGLLLEQPMHGYDLYHHLLAEEGLALIWHIKLSQLYTLLDKLEGLGMLVSNPEEPVSGPSRNILQVTVPGQQAFENWRDSPVTHPREIRQGFLARLYFARRTGIAVARQLIQRQREECQQWVRKTSELIRYAPARSDRRPIYQYRLEHTFAILKWLDQVETDLTA